MNKEFACIYRLEFPNGKYYIGQTWRLKRRLWEHKNKTRPDTPLYRALKKYGFNNIVVKILHRDVYWKRRFQYGKLLIIFKNSFAVS